MSKTRKLDSENPDLKVIAEAADIIQKGGVVVFPTRGLYGLAAGAFNTAAIQRVFEIKKRSFDKPILLLFRSVDGLDQMVRHVPTAAAAIMANYWPGKVTIIFKASENVSSLLTAGTGKIGIRLPGYPVASILLEAVGGPITGTSANISGEGGCAAIDEIDASVLDRADLVLDSGKLAGGSGSTVVDVTVEPPKILREGAVPSREIFDLLGIKPRG